MSVKVLICLDAIDVWPRCRWFWGNLVSPGLSPCARGGWFGDHTFVNLASEIKDIQSVRYGKKQPKTGYERLREKRGEQARKRTHVQARIVAVVWRADPVEHEESE